MSSKRKHQLQSRTPANFSDVGKTLETAFAADVRMKVASSAIAQVLTKIFT